MAEYIRCLIERDLASPGTQADISTIFGLGNSSGSDLGTEGYSAISEAIEAHWMQRTR